MDTQILFKYQWYFSNEPEETFRPSLKKEISMIIVLLDNRSQLSTLDLQSQVCFSMSNARPAGQRTAAKRIVPAKPARSHLKAA